MAIYRYGSHAEVIHDAEGQKSSVQRSQRTPTVTPVVAAFVVTVAQQYVDAPSQVYASQVRGQTPPVITAVLTQPQPDTSQLGTYFQPSLRAPPPGVVNTAKLTTPQEYVDPPSKVYASQVFGYTARIIPQFIAGPQLADLTLQGSVFEPLIYKQGPVPPFQRVDPQPDTSQLGTLFVKSQGAPPPGVINPVFLTTQQAYVDAPSSIIPASIFGYTSRVIPPLFGGPQQYDLTQQGLVVPSAVGKTGPVPPLQVGAPQLYDLTQQGLLIPAATRPLVSGILAPFYTAAPQLVDTTNYSFTTQPMVGIFIPPQPVVTATGGGGKKRKYLVEIEGQQYWFYSEKNLKTFLEKRRPKVEKKEEADEQLRRRKIAILMLY